MARFRFPYILTLSLSTLALGTVGCSNGSSPTEAGYQILPLMIGLIVSSIVSGIIVSRTGRYKALILGALGLMTVGIVLLTQLRADTDIPTLWLWMFVAGVGIGPTLSVFTIVVQNAVPFSQLGVAVPDEHLPFEPQAP